MAEAREHLITFLVMGLVALFCLGVGLVLLAILIAVAFWESHRRMALGGLTGVFLVAGAGVAWLAMHKARARPRLFAASLAELSKDRQHLRAGS